MNDVIGKSDQEKLNRLMPEFAHQVVTLMDAVASRGYRLKIVQGLRSFKEQDDLYAKGRSSPGRKVTNARSGQSIHNYGLAVDLALAEPINDTCFPDPHPVWEIIGEEVKKLGLEWGGDWQKFRDRPHVQVSVKSSMCHDYYRNGGIAAVWESVRSLFKPIIPLILWLLVSIGLPLAVFAQAHRRNTPPPRALPDRVAVVRGNLDIAVRNTESRTLAPDAEVLISITEGQFHPEIVNGNITDPPEELAGCRVLIEGVPARITGIGTQRIAVIIPHLGDKARFGQVVTVNVITSLGEWQDYAGYDKASPGLRTINAESKLAAGWVRVGFGQPDWLASVILSAEQPLPLSIALYGTGWRNEPSVQVILGGYIIAPYYAGLTPALQGFDSIAFIVPTGLALRGAVRCQVVTGGRVSNTVLINFSD